jgi:hypothetical protein
LAKRKSAGEEGALLVPDDLRVADAPERAQRGQQINGLEQVGFALRVAAEQHVKPRLERGVEPTNIPEVTQFELGQVHAALWAGAGRGSSAKPLKAKQRADLGHDFEVFHHETGRLVDVALIDHEEHLRTRLVLPLKAAVDTY